MYKIAVLVSGKGSTLDNLAFHCKDDFDGMLYGAVEISHVVADRECEARQIAEKWDLPFYICDLDNLFEEKHEDVDIWVMGGFLSKVAVPDELYGKVVNIHPSFLPDYGGEGMHGIKVHDAVIAAKEQFTGVTVHLVDNEYDHGPLLERIKMGVLPWDTASSLQDSVSSMEKKLYPRAILNYLKELRWADMRSSDDWREQDEDIFQKTKVPALKEKGWRDEDIDKIFGVANT
jgi:phosphoribosylglycinamide formyltransferase-1